MRRLPAALGAPASGPGLQWPACRAGQRWRGLREHCFRVRLQLPRMPVGDGLDRGLNVLRALDQHPVCPLVTETVDALRCGQAADNHLQEVRLVPHRVACGRFGRWLCLLELGVMVRGGCGVEICEAQVQQVVLHADGQHWQQLIHDWGPRGRDDGRFLVVHTEVLNEQVPVPFVPAGRAHGFRGHPFGHVRRTLVWQVRDLVHNVRQQPGLAFLQEGSLQLQDCPIDSSHDRLVGPAEGQALGPQGPQVHNDLRGALPVDGCVQVLDLVPEDRIRIDERGELLRQALGLLSDSIKAVNPVAQPLKGPNHREPEVREELHRELPMPTQGSIHPPALLGEWGAPVVIHLLAVDGGEQGVDVGGQCRVPGERRWGQGQLRQMVHDVLRNGKADGLLDEVAADLGVDFAHVGLLDLRALQIQLDDLSILLHQSQQMAAARVVQWVLGHVHIGEGWVSAQYVAEVDDIARVKVHIPENEGLAVRPLGKNFQKGHEAILAQIVVCQVQTGDWLVPGLLSQTHEELQNA
mmetsp:Transcript_37845/g.67612  ORF Transcript_37845/g.67612 Transcript_37845/m.67612 type:complete len:523 (+) Transcript_37845:114-1682(+)